MRFDVTWKLPNGQTDNASFDDESEAKQEAIYRANQYAIKHGNCEMTVADETGQLHIVQTNTYYA
jgi:hypothetical protein